MPELRTLEPSSTVANQSNIMPSLSQTGARSLLGWIPLQNVQSLPLSNDAACAERAFLKVVSDLYWRGAPILSRRATTTWVSFVVNSECVRPLVSPKRIKDEYFQRLRRKVEERLEEETLEDGRTHSAESTVLEAISESAEGRAAILRLISDEGRPELASAVLRLVGRVGHTTDRSWRNGLVKSALGASTPALREAAVETVEQWEDVTFIPLLKEHSELVPWLRDYIEAVIDDLSE